MGEEILPENSENEHDYDNPRRRTVKTNEMICQRYYTYKYKLKIALNVFDK